LKNGNLFILSTPLSSQYGNFATHPLFVPVMYGAALQGNPDRNLAYVVNKDIALETKQYIRSESDVPFVFSKQNEDYTFIPEQMMLGGKLSLNTHDGIIDDGYYELTYNDSIYHVFAYNFNRAESEMYFLRKDDLNDRLEKSGIANYSVTDLSTADPTELLDTLQPEEEFWKLFIIFALGMLLVEILILRFWK
jgi:hypothetical protein